MRTLAVALAAVFVISAFSGCFGAEDGSPSTANESSPSSTVGSGPAAANTSAGPANQPPVASLSVSANGTAVEAVNGTATVAADTALTFSAAGSTDPEGAAVTFSWTVDGAAGDSTTAEQNATLAAGNHTVTVVVSDGSATATAEMGVVALGSEAAPPPAEAAISLEFAGAFAKGAKRADAQIQSFTVPAGTQQITGWLTWDDDETGNSPLVADLDLFLLNPEGKDGGKGESLEFEYVVQADLEQLMPGEWKARILPYGDAQAGQEGLQTPTKYTLKILVWLVAPQVQVFTGSKPGANIGIGPGTGNAAHDFDIPEGTGIVSARLTWKNAASSTGTASRCNDYDLNAVSGGKQQLTSGNFCAFEFGFADGPDGATLPAGKWTFNIVAFTVVAADYTLTILYA